MNNSNKMTVEECSRWIALFKCFITIDKQCKKVNMDFEKVMDKISQHIILEYVENESKLIEESIIATGNY